MSCGRLALKRKWQKNSDVFLSNVRFYPRYMYKNKPSRIQCQDSNSRALEHVSTSITALPRLPDLPILVAYNSSSITDFISPVSKLNQLKLHLKITSKSSIELTPWLSNSLSMSYSLLYFNDISKPVSYFTYFLTYSYLTWHDRWQYLTCHGHGN